MLKEKQPHTNSSNLRTEEQIQRVCLGGMDRNNREEMSLLFVGIVGNMYLDQGHRMGQG